MKKENYLNLFRYLREFSMIRINIDRDILNSSKYLNVIWFSDLSHTSNIEAASFSHFDRENEFWLQVKRPGPEPKKPSFPKLPKALVEWIEVESLLDEVEGPKLKERIFNGTTWVYSSESKEVKNLFEVFFENHWFQELETYKNQIKAFRKSIEEYKDELKLYGDLFTIFNKASQFKDEFELILGFGLLHYHRDVNSTFFRRHLFTTPAEISFDDLSGAITIGPSLEYKITIESEFIDNQPVFEAINLAEAEKVFKENLSKVDKLDVFGGSIDHAIQGYVGRFSQEGEYKNYIGKGNTVETIPNLTFSPALLFRKRDSKGIARLYKEIIQQIENGPDGLSLPVFDKFFGVINSSESTNQEVIYDSVDTF